MQYNVVSKKKKRKFLFNVQVVKIEWRDKSSRQHKTFQFLLERFKATYLRHICPEFDDNFSLYKPNLELPTMRKPMNQNQDNYILCKVSLIKWIASFTHIARKDARVAHLSHRYFINFIYISNL